MKSDFRALIRSNANVMSLAPGGIDWGIQSEGSATPYVVLSQISMVQDYGNRGRRLPNTYRVQADCYANSAGEAETLSRAILTAIDGYQAEPFLGIFLISASDMPDGDENQPVHRVSMDFTIVYRG